MPFCEFHLQDNIQTSSHSYLDYEGCAFSSLKLSRDIMCISTKERPINSQVLYPLAHDGES